jgi:hypothetical protein
LATLNVALQNTKPLTRAVAKRQNRPIVRYVEQTRPGYRRLFCESPAISCRLMTAALAAIALITAPCAEPLSHAMFAQMGKGTPLETRSCLLGVLHRGR